MDPPNIDKYEEIYLNPEIPDLFINNRIEELLQENFPTKITFIMKNTPTLVANLFRAVLIEHVPLKYLDVNIFHRDNMHIIDLEEQIMQTQEYNIETLIIPEAIRDRISRLSIPQSIDETIVYSLDVVNEDDFNFRKILSNDIKPDIGVGNVMLGDLRPRNKWSFGRIKVKTATAFDNGNVSKCRVCITDTMDIPSTEYDIADIHFNIVFNSGMEFKEYASRACDVIIETLTNFTEKKQYGFDKYIYPYPIQYGYALLAQCILSHPDVPNLAMFRSEPNLAEFNLNLGEYFDESKEALTQYFVDLKEIFDQMA